MEEFSERLREAMAFRKFRQVDLANATKLDKGTISNYLSGKYKPKNTNVILIADALRVNTLWLLGYEGYEMETNSNVEVIPSTISDDAYTVLEWKEGFESEITKDKWAEFYDKLQILPDDMRTAIYKYVVLGVESADKFFKKQNS